MLLELSITDFAIIERSIIRFEAGLNALTGETGAGKSILLDALGAVLGQRVSSDFVRTGARVARIEGAFVLDSDELSARVRPIFTELGIELEDDTIIVTREVQASGRSTARVNGRLVTVAALSQLGSLLVDIHGQSDHLAILKATEQRLMLDRYAGLDAQRVAVGEAVRAWRAVRRQIEELTNDTREREQRIDLLRYQVEEIELAALEDGEDERLTQERALLQNADRLQQDAMLALNALSSDDVDGATDASSLLRVAERALQDLAAVDLPSGQLAERATELVVLAEDLARDLADYLEGIQLDPTRLEEVDDRLALIQNLKRKYGGTIAEILAFGDEASRELTSLTGGAFDLESLRAEEAHLGAELARQAIALSEARQRAAVELADRIEESIAELKMGRSELEIAVRHRDDPHGLAIDERTVAVDETGIDDVEFLIAPNAGETLRPLARIASGGETARIMLALKSILSDVDATPTLVFDEIDVGVGGRSGQVVGQKLWSLTRNHQVIVVSHLAQIAAFADHHLKIAKQDRDGRIVSTVSTIHGDERVDEIAAMLDGTPVTEASRANAVEMIDRSVTARESVAARAS